MSLVELFSVLSPMMREILREAIRVGINNFSVMDVEPPQELIDMYEALK